MLYLLVFTLFSPALCTLADDYFHSLYLDPNKTYHLSWKFNETHIQFHTEVKALGYVALGLSMDGSLKNADVFIAEVAGDQSSSSNYYGNADGKLKKEDPSKWHLMYFNETDTKTILTFSRKISGPNMVINITQSTSRVLWGCSEKDDISVNFEPNGVKSMILLQPKFPDLVMTNDTKDIEFRMNEALVPKDRTTYWCKSFAGPSLNGKAHIVMMSPYVQEGHELLVHHIVLYGCYKNSSLEKKIGVESVCYVENMPDDWKGCRSVVFAWAIGGSKMILPEHTGLSIGGDDDPLFFILEIHYDNPEEMEGVRDSSGLVLTVTETKRKFDTAILEVGYQVGGQFRQQIPPYAKELKYHGYCEACESMIQPEKNTEWKEEGIKVVATFLHGHLATRKIRLHHYRDGKKLDDISYDNNYDFNYQEMRLLKNEITVLKNDTLHVECIYDTTDRRNFTYGGLGTSDEMCLAYIFYYPRIELTNCLSHVEYDKNEINKDAALYKNDEDSVKKMELFINGLEPNIGFVQKCKNATNKIFLRNRAFPVFKSGDPTTVPPPTTEKSNNSAANCFLETGLIFILFILLLL